MDEILQHIVTLVSEYYKPVYLGLLTFTLIGSYIIPHLIDLVRYYAKYYRTGTLEWEANEFSRWMKKDDHMTYPVLMAFTWLAWPAIFSAVLLIGTIHLADKAIKKVISIARHKNNYPEEEEN